MLVGVNLATLDVGSIEEGDFFIKFKIRCKKHDFKSNLVLVYGPAQEDHKQRFLTELAHLSSKETLPMLIGGDFNIMRGPQEKSRGNFANRWPFLFNARAGAFGETIYLANNLPNQTFEKLDRVLVTTEWKTKYPKATVQALTREISDHTPLFLNSGDGDNTPAHSDFKFELGWLLREVFFYMVKKVWSSTDAGGNPLDRWQAKIRRLRQYLRGWAKNTGGAYKKEKKLLLEKLDELDKKSEHTQLDNDELNLKHALHESVPTPKRRGNQVDTSDVVLDEDRIDDIPKVSPQENEFLVAPFTVKEVRFFWNVIKADLMALFDDLHKGVLRIDRLNFGNIILIPKVGDANKIQQYRPICLLNVSFKFFNKVATNRITRVAHTIIRPSQTAFLPGRNIMEGAVVLHETLHELHRKNLNGIDFEKAYDKVRWDFLQQTLRMKGFSTVWCNWIRSFVQGGNVAVNVNGQNDQEGQGDPLSPILFNIAADMLAIIINRAKSEGKVNGVIPHLVEDGLSILQYADDMVIFLDHDLEKARNMKVLLCLFEKLSGLKINFHKSEIFCFGQTKECENDYSELFGCKLGSFPFRYMGLPMHDRKLNNSDWKHIEERFEKRLIGWKGKLLSVGERLVLINSVLSSLPMFMLSFFAIPKGVLKKLEYLRSRFFWQNDQHKKKYHLIKWDQIRQPKEQGTWGFSLLGWTYGYKTGFYKFGIVSHWRWHPSSILGGYLVRQPAPKNIYLTLFNIVRKKGATVAEVMSSVPLNVSFRRGLYGDRLRAWNELVSRVMNLELREERSMGAL
ncbi:hypothetical protein U9M48_000963 [Paspalum notatum var. saurae]|uniref:Reverse transcriptase domain-containing protein n=1 Tax=Paspalum notatum var. saurae TaxID=547442 RepID=A0AAQ3SGB5_PASNO